MDNLPFAKDSFKKSGVYLMLVIAVAVLMAPVINLMQVSSPIIIIFFVVIIFLVPYFITKQLWNWIYRVEKRFNESIQEEPKGTIFTATSSKESGHLIITEQSINILQKKGQLLHISYDRLLAWESDVEWVPLNEWVRMLIQLFDKKSKLKQVPLHRFILLYLDESGNQQEIIFYLQTPSKKFMKTFQKYVHTSKPSATARPNVATRQTVNTGALTEESYEEDKSKLFSPLLNENQASRKNDEQDEAEKNYARYERETNEKRVKQEQYDREREKIKEQS